MVLHPNTLTCKEANESACTHAELQASRRRCTCAPSDCIDANGIASMRRATSRVQREVHARTEDCTEANASSHAHTGRQTYTEDSFQTIYGEKKQGGGTWLAHPPIKRFHLSCVMCGAERSVVLRLN